MSFDKEFLKGLRELYPSEAIVTVVDKLQVYLNTHDDEDDKYKMSIETMSLLMTLCKKNKLAFAPPEVKGGKSDYISVIWNYAANFQAEHRKIMYREKVSSTSDVYHSVIFGDDCLSDSDIEEIQDLLLKLRQLVDGNEEICPERKESIFANITTIEEELHEHKIDIERIAGLLLPLWAKAKEIKDAYEIITAISGFIAAAIAKAHELKLLPGKGIAGFLN